MSTVIGHIGKLETGSGVDGPGIRMVVFMRGCNLRCVYCHNPELWDASSHNEGFDFTPEQLYERALRFKSYFGKKGGVTFSGGEPLLQYEFISEVSELLHGGGISTAIETSGSENENICRIVAQNMDYIMCDVKFSSDEGYRKYCRCDTSGLSRVEKLLKAADEYAKPVLLRHVAVPGLTGTDEDINLLSLLSEKHPSVAGVEFLPFRKLCIEKYVSLGIPFPLDKTPECSDEEIDALKLRFDEIKGGEYRRKNMKS